MFTRDDLVRLLRAAPFTAFRLHMSDGGAVDVLSREFVLPLRRYALVAIPEAAQSDNLADRYTTVYYMHVTRAEALQAGESPLGPEVPPAPATA